jgi:flagellar protein FliS
MNHETNGSSVYKQMSITTSSPTALIAMLYDGAIRFLNLAVEAIQRNDIAAKVRASDRALAIVQHLHLSLDMEQGQEISAELERIYSFVIGRILDGSRTLSTTDFREAIKVLDILRSAWTELVQKEKANAVPAELLAHHAANGRLALHG